VNLREFGNAELVAHIKALVEAQKKLDFEILEALQEVIRRKLYLLHGFPNLASYCQEVFGLSEDAAWKRSQVARTAIFFPEIMDLLKEGKTHITHLALIAPQITEANSDKILNFLPGASKRDLKLFLHNIMADGTIIDREPTIELKLDCTKEFLEKLNRARSLLSCAGATQMEVLESALDALLSKIDPVEKAKRAEKRSEKKVDTTPEAEATACAGAVPKSIPAKTKHSLFTNSPQCSYVSPEGRGCTATTHLQIDHVQMKCRGGSNDRSNLRLLCAEHNLYEAEKHLGKEYIKQKISSATHSKSVVLN